MTPDLYNCTLPGVRLRPHATCTAHLQIHPRVGRQDHTFGVGNIAHWLAFDLPGGQYAGRLGSLLSTLQALKTNAVRRRLLDALFFLSG